MNRSRTTGLNKVFSLIAAACVAASLLIPHSALAARPVGYMPGVTEEMTDPGYWSGMAEDPVAACHT